MAKMKHKIGSVYSNVPEEVIKKYRKPRGLAAIIDGYELRGLVNRIGVRPPTFVRNPALDMAYTITSTADWGQNIPF